MGYKYSFFDNQLIGVDALNEITSRLVTGGVSAAYSGADFDVYDINNSNFQILTGGVVPGSDLNLKITAQGSGQYLINKGLCFFDDGTTMEVDAEGEKFTVPAGSARHVYLVSDKNQMKCYPEFLSTEKQNGQFVYLGIINADGSITDKRTYARGKVPGYYSSNEGKEVNVSETYLSGNDIVSGQTLEISVGNADFHHLCIRVAGDNFKDGAGYPLGYGGLLYCDFENGVAKNVSCCSRYMSKNHIYEDGSGKCCRIDENIKIQNGKLMLPLQAVLGTMRVTFEYHLW